MPHGELEWTDLDSSMIEAAAYNEGERRLHVRFKRGQEYSYGNVPVEIYQGLLSAESAGKFLNKDVKGVFDARSE
jgi:hypothetical protein